MTVEDRALSERKIRWGIIGYGVIGKHHALAVDEAADAELVAVCDTDPKAEEKLRKEGWRTPFYPNQTAMFDSKSLDAVSVCTYSGIHYEAAMAAAERGIHVLSEKPLDVTLEHMDMMIAAADAAGVKLGGIFQRRTQPWSILAKKALEQGVLGRIVLCDSVQKYYRAPAYYKSAGWRGTWELDGGGALMNQAVHGIDLMLWLMGDVESVFTYSGTLARDIEVEDTSVSVLRFKNGALGQLTGATTVVPGQRCMTSIHGENGTISLSDKAVECSIGELVEGRHQPEEVDLAVALGVAPAEGEEHDGNVASDHTALSSNGHVILVRDFCDAIREDRDPMVTGVAARRPVELILAIYESMRTGKEVTLPLG